MNMNHKLLYQNIINKSKSQNRCKKDSYFEKHHIFPKCLGGDNSSDNIVLLTAKEHFVCHHLLCFIYPESKSLKFAFWAMCNQVSGDIERDYKVTSRTYEYAKLKFKEVNSLLHKGKKLSDEHLLKIKTRMMSDDNPMKGRKGFDNPLYNKERTTDVKSKISKTKLLNPTRNSNFKGRYITPLGSFFTSTEASKQHNLDRSVIIERCKVKSNIVITKKGVSFSKDLTPNDIGKTYKEVGWYFIPQLPK
jgi:hypothetical protein